MAEDADTQDLLRALLVLAIDERESRRADEDTRTEVLLSTAGLGSAEIAQLTGKNPSSVRVTLSRARKKA